MHEENEQNVFEESELEFISLKEKADAKKKRRTKRIVITVGCWLILAVVFLLGVFQTVRLIGRNHLVSNAKSEGPDLTLSGLSSVITTDEGEGVWQKDWVKYDGQIYTYNKQIMTFLIMGIDKNSDVQKVAEGTDGGQADALFLAVLNNEDKTIKVIGINRNTMADVDIYGNDGNYVRTVKAQIAVQHGFGNGMEESCEYQQSAVQKLLYNLPIHGYAAINMSAISTINDAVGGVDVTVLEDLTIKDKSLIKGKKVHLMGESAFWYVKYRDTTVFGSADMRLARQKQYLQNFIAAAKRTAKNDISSVMELYRAIMPQMVTNVSPDEIAYLAPMLTEYRFDEDGFYTMEGETVRGEQFEEFYPDEEALLRIILDVFYNEVDLEQGKLIRKD